MRICKTEIEKDMYMASKPYEVVDKIDLNELYLKLQKIYSRYERIYPDFKFDLALDSGGALKFHFHGKQSGIKYESQSGETVNLSAEAMSETELKSILDAQSSMLYAEKIHLGEAPTKEFVGVIFDSKPGDVLTFNTGLTLCVDHQDKQNLCFRYARQPLEKISMENFANDKIFCVDLSDPAAMRNLYRQCKNAATECCNLRVTTISSTRIQLESKIPREGTTTFKIGPETIYGKREGKSIQWFDAGMNVIPEWVVLRFAAWAGTAQVEYRAQAAQDDITRYDFYKLQHDIEKLFAEGKVDAATALIAESLPNNKITALQIHSLVRSENGYQNDAYIFAKKNEQVLAFHKVDGRLEPCGMKEIQKLWKEKYTEHYCFLNKLAQDYNKDSAKPFKETLQQVQDDTEKLAQKAPVKLQPVQYEALESLARAYAEAVTEKDLDLSSLDGNQYNEGMFFS